MTESQYITIQEAARRCGVSDKTIQRAIRRGTLPARYPLPNRCEIAVVDLEQIRAGQVSGQSDVSIEIRVAALERQVQALEQQIQQLLTGSAVSRAQSSSSRRLRERTTGSLPTHLVSVWAFAELHRIPEQKVQAHIDISLLPVYRGTWTDHDGQAVSVTFDAKGRQAFHLLYHEIPWFAPCSKCPHALPEHI